MSRSFGAARDVLPDERNAIAFAANYPRPRPAFVLARNDNDLPLGLAAAAVDTIGFPVRLARAALAEIGAVNFHNAL